MKNPRVRIRTTTKTIEQLKQTAEENQTTMADLIRDELYKMCKDYKVKYI